MIGFGLIVARFTNGEKNDNENKNTKQKELKEIKQKWLKAR